MPETLLQTKLYIPPLRPDVVPRPQLIERLNQGLKLGHKLTLVSAPAGFGKTTLISEWVSTLQQFANPETPIENRQPVLSAVEVSEIENQIAWLSLDESDNDLVRFLTYFVTALNQVEGIEITIGRGALGMLHSSQPPPANDVLTSLINDLTIIPGRIILVLDDYHSIDSSPIDEALTFFLEHLPPQMHLLIATRDDPQLPLSRLRARGQLTEMRAADLRFSPPEAAEFLNQVMGLGLSAEDIASLETRTEGWIAGLRLAALAMQGTISMQRHKDVAGFVKSFTGSHRFVLDYLIEEVLEQQPESIQDFLLQTAVLDRLTGPLCDALTGGDNGRETLEILDHANLFIISLDEERRWYRYHHLFSDLLRQRLRQKEPDRVPTLQQEASGWYEKNGFADEAIAYALRAGDFENAAHLIDEHADAIWQLGEHAKLRRWLTKLPIELILTKPHLCVFHAWYLFAGGQADNAERTLQVAEQALNASAVHAHETEPQRPVALSSSDRVKLRGRVAAIRAFMDSYLGNVPGIIQHARRALEYLPEQDSAWRSITAIVLGDAYGFKGDMAAAYEARAEALEICIAAGDIYYVMLASMKVAITMRSQGRLQGTMELCQQQIQLANERGLSQTSLNGLLLLIWGEVQAELNDLDGAIQQAKKGEELTQGAVDLAMLGWGYICLVRILFSRGDLTGIEEIIQKMENIARVSVMPPWVMNQMEAWQVRIWLVQDKLEVASLWASERGLDVDGEPDTLPEVNFFSLFDTIVLARILLAQGRLDESNEMLQQLLEPAETGGRTTRLIEILLLQALIFQAGGDTVGAMIPLKRSLILAEPEGFMRIFVDEGPLMARLLHEAHNQGIAPDYVRRLLTAFSSDEPVKAVAKTAQVDQSEMVEPLSERELEVLQRIAEGLTNREIAERLYLSLNTVKVHIRNIYGKLNVHSRAQAIALSQELGLLPRKSY